MRIKDLVEKLRNFPEDYEILISIETDDNIGTVSASGELEIDVDETLKEVWIGNYSMR